MAGNNGASPGSKILSLFAACMRAAALLAYCRLLREGWCVKHFKILCLDTILSRAPCTKKRSQVQTADVVQAWAADRSVVGRQQDGGADWDDEDMCVVCWERPKEVIFLSCGHMVSLRQSCASACCALGSCRALSTPAISCICTASNIMAGLLLGLCHDRKVKACARQPHALRSAPAGDVQQTSWKRSAAPSAPCAGERSRQRCWQSSDEDGSVGQHPAAAMWNACLCLVHSSALTL